MLKTNFTVKKDELNIVMDRVFEAPREELWKAMTDASTIQKWWGPKTVTTTVEKNDVRPGGRWRYIQKDAEGKEHGFRGTYKEVKPQEKAVSTFEYEPMPGHILTQTMTLEEIDSDKTKLTMTSHYSNMEDLDGMLNSGMESGATESWGRLAELVEN